MSVHDVRTARAAHGENFGESGYETSTIFEQPPHQQVAKHLGENLNRTSSVFEWPTRQQAAKNLGENLKRTSSIFERSAQHQATKGPEDRAKQGPAFEATNDPTKHQEAELIGRTLANKYTIESVIGTGSMGTIYRARQIALDKWVAVKILHQELAEQRNFVERFKFEAFSASRLEHPNSLRVLDFGEDGNLLHLVMEYVEADDLLTVMQREWPISDARIVRIMSQALAGLAKAHEVGIVHRDIKPENILILRETDDEGNASDVVKVCDFGIAKLAAPSVEQPRPFAPQLTTQGLVVGTPDYMSPEQARGESVDGRSDLYSMGVVLYHLLAGRAPFIADTPFGIAIQHVSEAPLPPSRHRAVNPLLERICMRAMNKRPEDRFQTAREMRRALLSALDPFAESGMAPGHWTSEPTRLFAAGSDLEAPIVREVPHAAATSWLNAHSWLEGANWFRRPNAIVAAAALVTIAILALVSLVSRSRDNDSPEGNGNVVRTTTVALTPAPPASAASTQAPDPARTQSRIQAPHLIPDDTHRPSAPSESELGARPAAVEPPARR